MTKKQPAQADISNELSAIPTNGTSQANTYLTTLDTMIKDVITHAQMAATACTGQFDRDDSVKETEEL
jgi:hypothetical protein